MEPIPSPERLTLTFPSPQNFQPPFARLPNLCLKSDHSPLNFNPINNDFNSAWMERNALVKLWRSNVPKMQSQLYPPEEIKNPSNANKPPLTPVVTPGPVLTGIGFAVRSEEKSTSLPLSAAMISAGGLFAVLSLLFMNRPETN